MTIAIPFAALLLSAGLMFTCNWLALIPWRRSKDKHWSEQARLAYPVLVAARGNLFAFPAIFAMAAAIVWPDVSCLWFFTGMAVYLGAYLGQIPTMREVFPRIQIRELLEQFLAGMLLRFPVWFVFIMAAILMPVEPNGATLLFGVFAFGMVAVWTRFGAWLARKIGFIHPAPDRLRNIAEAASTKMGIKFREVLVVRSPMSQAFALIGRKRLLFTDRILEVLSDDEIAAVCSHELAHLTESRWVRASRFIQLLMFWPWIFFKPILHSCGILGFFALCLTTICVPRIYRIVSHKMESRADEMARANEADTGAYASALARLYEDNLLPAVNSQKKATHPHLYDRLIAAGVTPNFPRPAPAKTMALHGSFFAGLMGLIFVFFAVRSGLFLQSN